MDWVWIGEVEDGECEGEGGVGLDSRWIAIVCVESSIDFVLLPMFCRCTI